MQRLTIEQALEKKDQGSEPIYIYVYHDGEVYFYIGISENPYTRLEQHMGDGIYSTSPSPLGELIIHNRPLSLHQWFMDVYTLAELAPDAYVQLREQQAGQWRYRKLAECLERELIRQYDPCLNSMWKRGKTLLPEKDQWQRIANAGVKITEED
jgi:hypothetical protein